MQQNQSCDEAVVIRKRIDFHNSSQFHNLGSIKDVYL